MCFDIVVWHIDERLYASNDAEAEFHNYVKVHEIADSDLPDYVYLELRYLLIEFVNNGEYSAVE